MKAHWRHLANIVEFVLSSAHPSPRPKWQIDQFSHFAKLTAECRQACPDMPFP